MNLSGIDVAVLSGPGNDNLHEVLLGMPELGDLGEVPSDKQMDAMYNYLVATRNAVAANPKTISHIEDPQAFLKMLDYAITYWYTDKRDEALDVLARNEEKLNFQNGFNSSRRRRLLARRLFGKRSNVASSVGSAMWSKMWALVRRPHSDPTWPRP